MSNILQLVFDKHNLPRNGRICKQCMVLCKPAHVFGKPFDMRRVVLLRQQLLS